MNGSGVFMFSSDLRRGQARDSIYLAAILSAGPPSAHNGWGRNDASKAFTISAPVETLDWADPHVHIMLKYQAATWEAVLAPLSRAQARGLLEEMLKPDTPVAIFGYPSLRAA
jgi:hypothetical protein